MVNQKTILTTAGVMLMLLSGCSSDDSSKSPAAVNHQPTVELGLSRTTPTTIVKDSTVTFVATAEDEDGDTLSYGWHYGLVGSNTSESTAFEEGLETPEQLRLALREVGHYFVEITVQDRVNSSVTKRIEVEVNAVEEEGYLLKTGVVKSLSASDDGSYDKGLSRRFVRDAEHGVVRDFSTNMLWQDDKVVVGSDYSSKPGANNFEKAKSYCQGLSLAGYDDWRLPNSAELLTLVNYGKEELPYIDDAFVHTAAVEGFPDSWFYWTSETVVSTQYPDLFGVLVDFGSGGQYNHGKEDLDNVRCVRGASRAYTTLERDDATETVIDLQSGLEWQDDQNVTDTIVSAQSGENNREKAIAYCEGLSLGGHSDWRLPNINELGSLIDHRVESYAVDTTHFHFYADTYYLSSTPAGEGKSKVTVKGNIQEHDWGYARCVREMDPRLILPFADQAHGVQPWMTDGTAGGTRMLVDLGVGAEQSTISFGYTTFYKFKGAYYYNNWFWPKDQQYSDGKGQFYKFTLSGAELLKDDFLIYPFNVLDDRLYFAGMDGAFTQSHGRVLWQSDGTSSGTVMTKDLKEDTYLDQINYDPFVFDDHIYFSAATSDGSNDNALWKSDGTESGTAPFIQTYTWGYGGEDGYVTDATVSGGYFFFPGTSDHHYDGLWKSDGVSYERVKLLNSGASADIREMTDLDGVLLFIAVDNTNNIHDLWRSDGSEAGTTKVLAASLSSSFGNLEVCGDKLYFSDGETLYASDGTTNGTASVSALNAILSSADIVEELRCFGDDLYIDTYIDNSSTFKLYHLNISDLSVINTVNDAEGFEELALQPYLLDGALIYVTESATEYSLWKYRPSTHTNTLVKSNVK